MRELKNNVFYVGVDDFDTTLFESQYIIPDGVSYNSYVICDKKIAILDTVDAVKAEEWQKNLYEVIADKEPDFLVVHHMEPDHSAMIKWALEKWPNLKLVASAKALQMIPNFFENIDLDNRTIAVKEGDELLLGSHKLTFYTAPMVHWPEVIVSYDLTEGVLYSADAFGKFGALSKCGFTSKEDIDWACEARRYYFNIVGKYGNQVKGVLAKLSKLQINAIRPLHGPLLEDSLDKYLGLYTTWSSYEPETKGVFIAVASIYGGTMEVANKLAGLLNAKGVDKVVVSDLCRSDMAENVEDAFRYSHIVLAASSYDGGVFTPMADFILRLREKGFTKRTVGLIENGSWAPCAARVMKEHLTNIKNINLLDCTMTIRSRMKTSDFPQLQSLAQAIIESM